MSHPADQITDLANELRELLAALTALLPEPVTDPTTGNTLTRRDITGHLGQRRGGSDANTTAALTAITSLAYGLTEPDAKRAARILNIWISHTNQIRDIDLEPSWAPLPSIPGTPPPACPYCRTYGLRFARQSGAVRCCNPRCLDSEENRPYGLIEQGKYTGRAMLVFADGREITYATEEPAHAAAS